MSKRLKRTRRTLATALLVLMPLASTAAPVQYTGTLRLTFKVTLKSNDVPVDMPIYCSMVASARQQQSLTNHNQTTKWTDNKRVIGARNGNKVTCVLSLPYSWKMDDALVPNYRFSASVGTSTPSVGEMQRSASGYDFPESTDIIEPIPPDGATTSFEIVYVM